MRVNISVCPLLFRKQFSALFPFSRYFLAKFSGNNLESKTFTVRKLISCINISRYVSFDKKNSIKMKTFSRFTYSRGF